MWVCIHMYTYVYIRIYTYKYIYKNIYEYSYICNLRKVDPLDLVVGSEDDVTQGTRAAFILDIYTYV